MKNAKIVLKLLVDGAAMSVDEIVAATGLTRYQTEGVVSSLRKVGKAVSEPVRYRLTPSGVEWAMWEPVSVEERKRRHRLRSRASRESLKKAKPVKLPKPKPLPIVVPIDRAETDALISSAKSLRASNRPLETFMFNARS